MFDNFFNQLSASLALPVDQIRYIFSILATYPLALFYIKCIPNKARTIKNLFSIISTIFLFIFVHDELIGFYHLMLSCIVTYLILCFFKGSLGSKLVFIWAMSHMSYTHIYRQLNYYGEARMDYSGPQMVWTIKLTMFAFNVYDGQRDIKKLTPYQHERRIVKLPSFIDFMGYMVYFGGFFVGPAFEYYEYERFLNAEEFEKDPKGKKYIPSTILPSIKCFLLSLICAIVPVFISPKMNVRHLLEPKFYQRGFISRMFVIFLVSTLERFKYYFAWLLAEGACVLSGLGYLGKDEDGNDIWGGVTNVRISYIEAPENLKMVLENWNVATNQWLRNYIYLRLTPPGTKPTFISQISTFAVSAFWHGFYPGYYLTFLFGGFVNETARKVRRAVRPAIISTNSPLLKGLYDVMGTFTTLLFLNYLVIPFLILDLYDSYRVNASVYFCLHIICALALLFFNFGGDKLFPKSKVQKVPPTTLAPIPTNDKAPTETEAKIINKKLS